MRNRRWMKLVWFILLVPGLVFQSTAAAPLSLDAKAAPLAAPDGWFMAGANPSRTSWVEDEVGGRLSPVWYKTFDAFIPARVQVIATGGSLYIATARGLYALDAETGAERWTYPTRLPLGNSPTVVGETAYVAGQDRRVHAVNTQNGQRRWVFEADSGFDTSPLVIDGQLFIGSRGGIFYALGVSGAQAGRVMWTYRVPAGIHFSAAISGGIVYFAADDNRAYALDAATGKLVWKSEVLPGMGFRSWWPVVYRDKLILAASSAQRAIPPLGDNRYIVEIERDAVFKDFRQLERGSLIGARDQAGWLDATAAVDYLEQNPANRTYLVLDRTTGKEITFDLNKNGKPDYAPVLFFGTHSGMRYPPVVGPDGNLYQTNSYANGGFIPRGHVSGWRYGTTYISTPANSTNAVDEPMAYAGGGNNLYWNQCCDRSAGAFELPVNGNGFGADQKQWAYYSYNLAERLPGYAQRYTSTDIDAVFGGANGVYGQHGDQNPPVPYRGKVYFHRSNSLIAFGPLSETAPVHLPNAKIQPADEELPAPAVDDLKKRLEEEVEKILAAGHLRPAFASAGNFDRAGMKACGENLMDYWHDPSDTLVTLLRALPYLPVDVRSKTRLYIQNEFENYPLDRFSSLGWKDGAAREGFLLPPEMETLRTQFGPRRSWFTWSLPPHRFYTLWLYAREFGNPRSLFDRFGGSLDLPPEDDDLLREPYILNSFIAGYWGYLELEKMAAQPESKLIRQELERMLKLRADGFSKDSPFGTKLCTPSNIDFACYCKAMSASRNYLYLTPELGAYLNQHALPEVQASLNEINRDVPYWMAAHFDQTYGEGVSQPIYDAWAVFLARAWILNEPFETLSNYLDAPAFPRGDLAYLQNLTALLDAAKTSTAGIKPAGQVIRAQPSQTPVPQGSPVPVIYLPDFQNTPVMDRFGEMAVVWFGLVTPEINYTDLRIGYNRSGLVLFTNTVDRRVWNDPLTQGENLSRGDSVEVSLALQNADAQKNLNGRTFRFTAMVSARGMDDGKFTASAVGDGSDWKPADIPFTVQPGWRGDGLNNDGNDKGWSMRLEIPFTSLGLSGPPPAGTRWRMQVRINDRDSADGPQIAATQWVSLARPADPSSWGFIQFGMPVYTPPATANVQTLTLRQGLNGTAVVDAGVGGMGRCGPGNEQIWTLHPTANFAGGTQFNVQNQIDTADWPCYSKFYITFPLDRIPEGKVIRSARLVLHQFGNARPTEAKPSYIQVFQVSKAWNEKLITWNNAPDALQNIGGTWVQVLQDRPAWPGIKYEWDITRAVAEAHKMDSRLHLALYSADFDYHSGKYFSTSDAGDWNAEARPTLIIEWGDP